MCSSDLFDADARLSGMMGAGDVDLGFHAEGSSPAGTYRYSTISVSGERQGTAASWPSLAGLHINGQTPVNLDELDPAGSPRSSGSPRRTSTPRPNDPESLQRLAKREDRPEMHVFKAELRQAITHPDQLPSDELFDQVQYDDGSDKAFLRRLWRDLYGDEPVTGPGLRSTS